jgi:hypothetical protein
MARVDMRRVFDRNFNRLEPPLLEGLKQFGALVGERGREKKGINADSHSLIVRRGFKRSAVVSIQEGWGCQ